VSEQKNVRVRDEIKQFGQAMERRMRGREPEILAGTLVHLRQMGDEAVAKKLQDHAERLSLMLGGNRVCDPDQAADLANYAMEALRRIEAGG
jgi:hypothetical protein